MSTTYTAETLEEIRAWTACRLASEADTYVDDDAASSWLGSVRSDVLERVEYDRDRLDSAEYGSIAIADYTGELAHEIADSAIPVYTGDRWAVFGGTRAFHEDVEEISGDCRDMTTLAGVALYLIAERLAVRILEQVTQALSDDDNGADRGVSA